MGNTVGEKKSLEGRRDFRGVGKGVRQHKFFLGLFPDLFEGCERKSKKTEQKWAFCHFLSFLFFFFHFLTHPS